MLCAPCRARRGVRTQSSRFVNQDSWTSSRRLLSSCYNVHSSFNVQPSALSTVNLVDTKSSIMDPVMAEHGWLCGACAPAQTFRHLVLCRKIVLQLIHPCVYVFTFLQSRPHTVFMTCCSNVKLWPNADSCMDNGSRPCKHISLMRQSHIFIAGLYTRVGR